MNEESSLHLRVCAAHLHLIAAKLLNSIAALAAESEEEVLDEEDSGDSGDAGEEGTSEGGE